MIEVNTQRKHFPALDVWRGIAILLVVFYHVFDYVSFFRFGWIGVDLFFVLSGFLITDVLFSSLAQKHYFRNFYLRRALRIFPLYYLVLLVFFSCINSLFKAQGAGSVYSYYHENQFWFWLFIQNWLFVLKGSPPVPYLTHFWSLAIEEQFYVLWPLLLFLIKKPHNIRVAIVALIMISLITRILIWCENPDQVEAYYFNTFTRMDSLAIGGMLALIRIEGKQPNPVYLKIILFLFCSFLIYATTLHGIKQDGYFFATFGYTFIAVSFASLLQLSIDTSETVNGIFKRLKLLIFFGKISYGMYVFHLPIYLILGTQLSRIQHMLSSSETSARVIISFSTILLTIFISTLSFYWMEKPLLSFKKYFQ